MIQSFADANTEELFHKEKNRRFSQVARVALRKLIQMNRARQIADLSRIHAKPAVKGLVCQGETSGEIPAHHQVSSPVHGRGKGCDGVDRRHTSDDSVAAVS